MNLLYTFYVYNVREKDHFGACIYNILVSFCFYDCHKNMFIWDWYESLQVVFKQTLLSS